MGRHLSIAYLNAYENADAIAALRTAFGCDTTATD
jgi:hypothetical protein